MLSNLNTNTTNSIIVPPSITDVSGTHLLASQPSVAHALPAPSAYIATLIDRLAPLAPHSRSIFDLMDDDFTLHVFGEGIEAHQGPRYREVAERRGEGDFKLGAALTNSDISVVLPYLCPVVRVGHLKRSRNGFGGFSRCSIFSKIDPDFGTGVRVDAFYPPPHFDGAYGAAPIYFNRP